MDRSELVAAYWQYYRTSTSSVRADRLKSEEWLWASDHVHEVARTDGVVAVDLLCDLAEAAPDASALSYLGAGPVEDLLHSGDPDVVAAADAAARRSVPFRTALRCAWFDRYLDADDAARLRRFGPPI